MTIYTEVSISGYNTNPPPDDGTEVSDNEVTWAKHKTKLADPIKVLAEAMDDNIATAFGKVFLNGTSALSSATTLIAAHHGKIITTTNAITLSLTAAATLGDGWNCIVINTDGATVTIDPNGAETINGAATINIAHSYGYAIITCNGTSFSFSGYDKELEALASVTSAANKIPYFTGSGAAAVADFTASGRAMVATADAAAQTALLDDVVGDSGSGGTKGLVPAPGVGDYAGGDYLDAGGNWSRPSVSQGDINASTGSVSHTGAGGSSAHVTLPGGLYGWFPQTKINSTASGGAYSARLPVERASTAYATCILLENNAPVDSKTVYAQQRYVTASPPYDLGDGEVGGFIFLLLNKAGEAVASYIADTPPWAYNGKTDIRPKFIDTKTGKKFKLAAKKKTLEQILDLDRAEDEFELEEITHAIKNADMGDIPHPFGTVPKDHTVVLLDPMDERVRRLINEQNAGNTEISEFVSSGAVFADNEDLKRNGPKGVKQVGLRIK